jgi:hypothetical protein
MQGIENVLKSSLLFIDYHRYKSTLNKRPYGHDVMKISKELERRSKFFRNIIDKVDMKQFGEVSRLYRDHKYRYAGIHTIFIVRSSDELNFLHVPLLRGIARMDKIVGRAAKT